MHVVVHRGSRHDLGNPGGYLKAAVDFALERDDYGPELRRLVGRATGADATVDEHAARHGPRMAERRIVRSVEEQQARVAAAAVAPRPVRVAIAEAQGLMCAEEVVTERPLPGFDQAAIDGYAVRSVDVLGVGLGDRRGADDEDGEREVSLPVMGEIEAGARTPSRLQPRQAARVQTGAPMPTLADAVLPLRWTDGGRSGCGCCAACGRAPTCAAPATTCSPVTSPCARARSSAPRRSGCSPRSAASGCWCIRGRGCR